MQVFTRIQQNSYIISLNGILDGESAAVVQEALQNAFKHNPKEILIDCEALEEISPKSLKMFLAIIRKFQQEQVRFILISVSQQLNNLFVLLGLSCFIKRVNSSSLIASDEACDIYLQQL